MKTANAIIIRQSARGYRVHPPYKHSEFVAAFKRTVGGRWYAESGEWFVPAEKLEWAVELLGYWFKLPVLIECAAPVVNEADAREALIADVEAAWHRVRPFASIADSIRQAFGVTKLDSLTVEQLKQILAALQW